ncbi:MAG TPA: hypothetical protein ENI05_07555 [Porticoccus sp.]|nr:hypothetical protein [Porticoccus sp.]
MKGHPKSFGDVAQGIVPKAAGPLQVEKYVMVRKGPEMTEHMKILLQSQLFDLVKDGARAINAVELGKIPGLVDDHPRLTVRGDRQPPGGNNRRAGSMSDEKMSNEDAMTEIIERLRALEIGKQGVVIIFAEGSDVDIFSHGIHPDSEARVIENALARVIRDSGN